MPKTLNVWVDDIRVPPSDDWIWFKNSSEALDFLNDGNLGGVWSLDHDLGGDDTSRPIVLWFCEHDSWPVDVRVHSANPVGVEWLEGVVKRYFNR